MALLTDPVATAGLVTREVRTGSRAGVPTRIAVARRSYPTEQADLWDALTNAERLPRWFLPITGELGVGGRYQLEGNAGGVVEECDEPRQFAVTWEMGPQVSWLRVTLTPGDDGTVLELEHEAPVDPQMWEQFGPGAVGVGWDLALMGLDEHVRTGEPVDTDAALTLHTTPDGITFIRTAAESWADAAIADGDDPTTAHTAAEQTIVFYTTEPEEGAES
ncbi:SRPBCC family protein [Nocardia farcinica]|uniref:SRPBCC family protein n=1 Tax=Nocardia farcinica TaxID=37329 RepID=UPI001895B0BB|nr:SRPBCC family protein [Nocardia farcinica]MBF6070259.1 SRPBCC family protein [Nocardia farcinica]MBF6138915.1 SRPBCC family protein [Nocardia farcinica]MBF6360901.1 SRPBCC family protein [Nocardia farcinica]MBF6386962.1 SRPBCC family protein [Nocardia farcinica]MBF6443797.1 SRPBCC family protein [Nocardia farcinica]